MRIAVLSDTHAPRYWKRCPDRVAAQLDGVDAILHAGDVCIPEVLAQLSAFAPLNAVRGNNDGDDVGEWGATGTFSGTFAGLRIAMIHDSGPAPGRLRRMRQRFPDADLVVFGHSHIPLQDGPDVYGFRIFNPGSPTDRRRQPHGTMGLLDIVDGVLVAADIVEVS